MSFVSRLLSRFSPKPVIVTSEMARSVIAILFPPMETDEAPDGTKFLIDKSADSNLQTALNDLHEGYNDTATHAAIGDVLDRLSRVRKILGAYSEFKLGQYSYVIVDTVRKDPDVRVNDID